MVDGLAELQVRFPSVPVVFCETRKLAEDWTYRFLSAAYLWAGDPVADPLPSNRSQDLQVPDRGRLRPEIILAWHAAHV